MLHDNKNALQVHRRPTLNRGSEKNIRLIRLSRKPESAGLTIK